MADQEGAQAAQQLVDQAVQAARQASQSAEQAAQAVQQAARALGGETTRQMVDAVRTASSQEVGAEREFEIGKDESYSTALMALTRAYNLNDKILADEIIKATASASQVAAGLHEQVAQGAINHANALNVITQRILTNAATHDNDLAKQHLAHRDIATDRTWNVDEVAALVAKSAIFQDAIAAAVARAATEKA